MCLLIFLSGLLCVSSQILWAHFFGSVMDATHYTPFLIFIFSFLGLSIGFLLSLKYLRPSSKSLRSYSIVLVISAVFSFFLPFILDATSGIFIAFYANYYGSFGLLGVPSTLFCVFLLMLPSVILGLSIPLLIRTLLEFSRVERSSWASLYSLFGLGLGLGLFLMIFFLLPSLGYSTTLYVIVALTLLSALLAFLVYKKNKTPLEEATRDKSGEGLTPKKGSVFVYLSISIFAIGLYLFGSARILLMLFDTTVYSISLFFLALILAVTSATMTSHYLSKYFKDHPSSLAIFKVLTGVSILISAAVQVILPIYVVQILLGHYDSFFVYRLLQFFIIFAVLFLPSFFFGLYLAGASGLALKDVGLEMRRVGTLYIMGFIGASISVVTSMYLLTISFGLINLLLLSALVFLSLGSFAFLTCSLTPLRRHGFVVSAVLVFPIFFLLLPAWDNDLISGGPVLYSSTYGSGGTLKADIAREMKRKNSVIHYEEGLTSTVAVARNINGDLSLIVDGSVEVSSNRDETAVHELLADIALLLHGRPKDILLLGLGGGVTLEAVTMHSVESIDFVEVTEEIVNAAKVLREVNGEALLDWRVRLLPGDGRADILSSGKRYDVILSNPPAPWIYGSSRFFTDEYYSGLKGMLSSEAIVAQWVNGTRLSDIDLKSIVRTFSKNFPHSALWEVNAAEGDYILMGSLKHMELDYSVLKDRFEVEKELHHLDKKGLNNLSTLISYYTFDEDGMKRYSKGAKVNTYDNAFLEFSAPACIFKSLTLERNVGVTKFRASPETLLSGVTKDEASRIADTYHLATIIKNAEVFISDGEVEKAVFLLDEITPTISGNVDLQRAAAKQYLRVGLKTTKEEKITLNYFQKAVELFPEYAEAWFYIGRLHLRAGRGKEAGLALKTSVRLNPKSPRTHFLLSELYKKKGFFEVASTEREVVEKLLKGIPMY
ncbi:MAG: hypothetical protein KAT46_05000 [Deltaproteobacteria bacterium]|nr:hypothetical protein [Deltaproteobacteria bacterium]